MNFSRIAVKLICGMMLGSVALFTTTGAFAHHGWSWYGSEPFTLTAEVVDKRFGNPHDQLTLKDADGQVWDVLLSPPGRSRRAGLTGDLVEVGATVTVFGHRRSEGNNFEMKTERLQIGEKIYNLYPNRS